MEELPRLKGRISSLHEMRDLIHAMRAMAASRVREAQGALTGIREYVEVVEDAIAVCSQLLPEADRGRTAIEPAGGTALVVMCSEHGFTGAFNGSVLERARQELRPGQRLGILGHRGAFLAEEMGLDIAWRFPMATHVGGILALTRKVAEQLADVAGAKMVFGSLRTGGHFEVEVKQVLPLDPALVARAALRSAPLHHIDPEELLYRLAEEYLFAEITHAATESLASENGARLQVMEAADRSIGDKLEVLTRQERNLRQESITSELFDVVVGAEAIVGEDGG